MNTLFQKKVYEFVRKIPKGRVKTYASVARAIGHPAAARAVGNALKRNIDTAIPCHRVVRSDGKIGGYNGLMGKKIVLLKKERAI